MPSSNTNIPAVPYYTPPELLGTFRNYLEKAKTNNVVWLRGIYIQKPIQNAQWAACYDELRDVNSNATITLKISREDRNRLKPNSLVMVGGIVELATFQPSTVRVSLTVTRIEIIKDQFVSEQDIQRSEIRIAKSKRGFKNVDSVLEDKLFRDETPKVALILAASSITMDDFDAGVNAAAVKIDFTELRTSFGNGNLLADFLRKQDVAGFDTIALIRGGGSGIEALDDINVLKAISEMNTPVICAIGHVGEDLFLKSIADKVAPTPNGLGQYFSEMVERVTAKRNNSRAALIEEVKKQFQKQIEESNKKNQDLLKQVQNLTKQQEAQTKANNENIKNLTEQNKKNLEAQQKKNEEALAKIQAQNKQQTEVLKKQNEGLQKQLENLTKSQKDSINKLTEQNKQTNTLLEAERKRSVELERQLAAKPNYTSIFIIIAIVAALVGFITAQILK